MFRMDLGGWDWGWGWAAPVGGILVLGIFLVPWFFFLLNLNGLLERVKEQNRAISPSSVWLNFVPLLNLVWFLYTVLKVRDSVRTEYGWRRWEPDGDFGYNVGVAAGVLLIASVFFWWIPLIGWAVSVGWFVCWIIYWLKMSEIKKRLEQGTAWNGTASPPPPYSASRPPYSSQGGPAPSGSSGYRPPTSGAAASGAATAATSRPVTPASGPAPGSAAPAGETAAASGPAAQAAEPGATGHPGEKAGREKEKLCMACGAPYDSADKFCRSCGLPLPKERG